ncbi:MAG: glycosyltransferase family 4 protein [Myxococcales bacterium]|nr:glycosyltransferase family 4 protein [Myxococcales bacterium]
MTPFHGHNEEKHTHHSHQTTQPLLVFCNRWLGRQGGAERYLLQIAEGLQTQGVRCILLYLEEGHDATSCRSAFERCIKLSSPDEMGDCVSSLSPHCVYLHQWPYEQLSSPALQSIQRWVHVHDSAVICPRRHKYFLSNSQTCHHPIGWRCAVKCGQFDIAGDLPGTSPSALHTTRKALADLHFADRILCGSTYLAQMLRLQGLPSEKITPLPLALSYTPPQTSQDTQEQQDFIPKMDETSSKPTKILFVGSILRSKGLDLLFQALWKLDKPFTCEIVGQGEQEAGFRALAKLMGFGRGARRSQEIVWLGWRSPKQLHAHYQDAEIVVLPSRTPETFGLVGLEAMHHARPVVAFDVGGVSEWLLHAKTGYLAPPSDIDAFSQALRLLMHDPQKRQAMGMAAQRRVQQSFSFEAHIQAFSKLFYEKITTP